MTSDQIAVRLPSELLSALDDLVALGVFPTRAAAVRAGIETITERQRRRAIDAAIVEGYRKTPPTSAEAHVALTSLRNAIAEEPW